MVGMVRHEQILIVIPFSKTSATWKVRNCVVSTPRGACERNNRFHRKYGRIFRFLYFLAHLWPIFLETAAWTNVVSHARAQLDMSIA